MECSGRYIIYWFAKTSGVSLDFHDQVDKLGSSAPCKQFCFVVCIFSEDNISKSSEMNIMFCDLKLEIASAILASNELKMLRDISAG